MKIFLAGGTNLTSTRGIYDRSISREVEVCNMFLTWKRLYSYWYYSHIYYSGILKIVKNENR